MAGILNKFSILANISQRYHPTHHRSITTTKILFAEPPRKKVRVDPAILKLRIERKIRKAEREILKIENDARHPIPLLEYQPSGKDIRDLQSRPAHNMNELGITPNLIKAAEKLWSMYRSRESHMERYSLRQVEKAQQFALDSLKEIDKELYDKTVAVDEISLIPYRSSRVKSETGPIPNYKPPDGMITNLTREWVM